MWDENDRPTGRVGAFKGWGAKTSPPLHPSISNRYARRPTARESNHTKTFHPAHNIRVYVVKKFFFVLDDETKLQLLEWT